MSQAGNVSSIFSDSPACLNTNTLWGNTVEGEEEPSLHFSYKAEFISQRRQVSVSEPP